MIAGASSVALKKKVDLGRHRCADPRCGLVGVPPRETLDQ